MGCGCAERRKKMATALKKVLPKSEAVQKFYTKAHTPPAKKETPDVPDQQNG